MLAPRLPRRLSAGVDVRTVAGRLGHANASITLNTYSHYVRSAAEAAAAKLEGFLGGLVC